MGLIFFTLENKLFTAGHKRTQVCERIIETGKWKLLELDQLSNWRRSPRPNSGLHRVSLGRLARAARCTHGVVLGVVWSVLGPNTHLTC